jgi:hypothetical protein
LTTPPIVGIISNMDAEPVLAQRLVLDESSFVELVIWRLREPVEGCAHDLKYRLAYVVEGICVVRYDNEAGKGDHRHVGGRDSSYRFRSFEALEVDFWADVAAWEGKS